MVEVMTDTTGLIPEPLTKERKDRLMEEYQQNLRNMIELKKHTRQIRDEISVFEQRNFEIKHELESDLNRQMMGDVDTTELWNSF